MLGLTGRQVLIACGAVGVELGRALTHDGVVTFGDALTPAIVGGAILSLGLQAIGLYSRPPEGK